MEKHTFLITGANGQVGWELQRTLSTLGRIIAIDREELDLCDADAIRALVRDVRPAVIVNAAAYTAVDQAEREEPLALKLNADAPRILAEEAKRLKSVFVSYSTDYVFDGTAKQPYTEDSVPHPLGAYGRTKLAGDKAVTDVGGAFLIFRTSWVYGNRGKNFYLTMLRLAAEGKPIGVVNDQFGAPTWSRAIAEATAQIIARINGSASQSMFEAVSPVSGIYNMVSSGHTSWFEFAKAIFEQHGVASQLSAITSDEYPTPTHRPQYSVLSTSKLAQTFGIHMPEWEHSLGCVCDTTRKSLARDPRHSPVAAKLSR
jgi:dTDP-4-dehydrorhamnose reductase